MNYNFKTMLRMTIFSIILIFLFIGINNSFENRENKPKNYANEITREHEEEAFGAAWNYAWEDLEKEDDVKLRTVNIVRKNVLPFRKHVYRVQILVNYVLEDFVDDFGRNRIMDGWEIDVEYIGREDGEWDFEKNKNNWKLIDIHHWSGN